MFVCPSLYCKVVSAGERPVFENVFAFLKIAPVKQKK